MSDRERAELLDELEVAKRANLPCLVHDEHERRTAASLWIERRVMRARCAHGREDLRR